MRSRRRSRSVGARIVHRLDGRDAREGVFREPSVVSAGLLQLDNWPGPRGTMVPATA
jgi:hypothetical protein